MLIQNIKEYGKVIGVSSKSGSPALNTLYYIGPTIWEIESLGESKLIKNVDKGRYLAANGNKPGFAKSKYEQNARWSIENAEDGLVRLRNEKLGQYLMVKSGLLVFGSVAGKEFESLWQPLRNVEEVKQDLERKKLSYDGGNEIRIRSRMGIDFIVTDQGSCKLAEGLAYDL